MEGLHWPVRDQYIFKIQVGLDCNFLKNEAEELRFDLLNTRVLALRMEVICVTFEV